MTDPIEREAQLGSAFFPQAPFTIVGSEGAYYITDEGRRLLDVGASHGMNHLGHNHSRVVAALVAQLSRSGHVPLSFANDTRLALYERLVGAQAQGSARFDRAWLCATGTEANEAAIKFARQATGRSGIISLRRGFHGRTLGSLSATHKKPFQDPFLPLVPGFTAVTPDDEEGLKSVVGPDTAAVFIEPVQGEGGVYPLSESFVRAARDITTDAGALLVADEIQTGLGRTGHWYGIDAYRVQPDMVTLGKGLGGGLPLSACLTTEEVMSKQAPKTHGSTFSGNPLTCAAGVAVLDTLVEERLVERAVALGAAFESAFAPLVSLPGVRELRVRGAMVGIELRGRNNEVLKDLVDRDVLAIGAGPKVVRLLPPFILDDAQVAQLCDDVVAAVTAHASAAPGPSAEVSAA